MGDQQRAWMNRRQWLYSAGMVAGASQLRLPSAAAQTENPPAPKPLDLSQYEPKSMLRVHESRVERAKFPLIDFHTHISASTKSEAGVELAAERQYLGTAQELLATMDRKNIHAMVNLTGGYERDSPMRSLSTIGLIPADSIHSLNRPIRDSKSPITRSCRLRQSNRLIVTAHAV